ncbi:GH25 family lysozyme [Sphingomonas sp.]|jgi:lysozyme|uniref:GH25 family lysozyme n=1 Tax=Sphingomonas sp. TaxID=28214 RepID=UPI002E3038F5|nr:GH25 family lysozyme [Sphingomonas sp.]HEX4694130.1 GH25 family lysozyme [Sphingomonas sp.]
MRRRRWWGVLAAIAAVFALALYVFAIHWRPSTETYDMQGVDVSAANGAVDWVAVKAAGAAFGYVAATSGNDRDAAFEDNWRGAASARLRRGAIHIWSLCAPATDQANNFNTTAPQSDDSLPPALSLDFVAGCDARPERAAVLAELARFIAMVEAHSRRPVLLLVSRAFEARYRVTAAIDRPVWSAQNFFAPDYAARPWRMWRASDMRRIDGVDGPINWDVVAK